MTGIPYERAADIYAIAALMMQVEGWERTGERRSLPIYGLQRVYRRKPGGRDAADEPMPGYLD